MRALATVVALALSAVVLESCLLQFDPALLAHCTGCQSGTECVAGDSEDACGADGAACSICSVPAASCFEGRCVVDHAVVQISIAGTAGGLLDRDGQIWVWGTNNSSQLGLPNVEHTTPVVLSGGWSEVAFEGAQGGHACAIASGQISCWGLGNDEELGNGTMNSNPVPEVVGTSTNWTHVGVGAAYSCAIQSPGTLWCWGWSGNSRIGKAGPPDYEPQPTQVGSDTTWKAISLGAAHACGIRNDGSLYCWGSHASDALGRPGEDGPPGLVAALSNGWLQVSAGDNHTCGIRTDQAVYCWGDNSANQLGISVSAPVPTLVDSAKPWRQVSAGAAHTCGVRMDGTLWCWGDGGKGQIGFGVMQSRPTPTQVGTRTDWLIVDSSTDHTCAVTRDGTMYCFGNGDFYQLGNGSMTKEDDPTPVPLGG